MPGRRLVLFALLMLACALPPVGTAATPASPSQTAAMPLLRVAVISDLNGSYGTVGHPAAVGDAVSRIVELEPDLVISTGDMVAGQRRSLLPAERVAAMWRAFHETVTEPLAAAGIPFAVTPGNHDASAYPRFAAERRRYAAEWRDRGGALQFVDRADYPFNYAFRAGDVLFVSLDVTTTGRLPDDTRDWLRELLRRAGGGYRYRVVFSHVPLWPVAEGRARESTRDRELHDLLAEAGVDLYLSGHHHVFYPGVADGIAFISQSCLGSGTRRLAGSGAERADKSFTLLEFDARAIRAAALVAPDYTEAVNWQTLPPIVRAGGVELLRADLAEGQVAPLRSLPDDHPRSVEAVRD